MNENRLKLTDREITRSLQAASYDSIRLTKIKKRLEYVTEIINKTGGLLSGKDFLIITLKGNSPYCHPLSKETLTIGRGEQSDLEIADANISRVHCRLQKSENRWQISDMNSKNGLSVNNKKIKERLLCDGDLIKIGNTEIVFIQTRFNK